MGNKYGTEGQLRKKEQENVELAHEKTGVPDTATYQSVTSDGEIKTLHYLIDWVEVTFHGGEWLGRGTGPLDFLELLGISTDLMELREYGHNGYLHSYSAPSGLAFDWGTPERATHEMGGHLTLSGQACRLLERQSGFDWLSFMGHLREVSARYTRLDVALDDFARCLNLDVLRWYLQNGFVTSNFRTWEEHSSSDISDGRVVGDTIYFGSPKSNLRFRFYDKRLERLAKGQEVDVAFWQRYEIQIRKEQAQQMSEIIMEKELSMGEIALGIIRRSLSIKSKHSAGKNKARWAEAGWWQNFCGSVLAVSLHDVFSPTTLSQKLAWASSTIMATMKMAQIAFEKAEPELDGAEFLGQWLGYEILNKSLGKEAIAFAKAVTITESAGLIAEIREKQNPTSELAQEFLDADKKLKGELSKEKIR